MVVVVEYRQVFKGSSELDMADEDVLIMTGGLMDEFFRRSSWIVG